ncbi:MAG: hypothetical protein M0P31_05375 [Solirubrobacteraceae bacterium]|nr:hypothetical protein [Solirubrobacteraceae bacterium]
MERHVALTLRGDGTSLDDDAISATILQARRIVVEGLTHPDRRGPDGYATARLLPLSDADAT